MLRIFANRIASDPYLTIAQAQQLVVADLSAPVTVESDCIEAEERAHRTYRRLPAAEAQDFLRLALSDLENITIATAAAELGVAHDTAARLLLVLRRFHLIEDTGRTSTGCCPSSGASGGAWP